MARAHIARPGTITFGGAHEDGVTISGSVVDIASHEAVGNVEVVFLSPQGEESTTASADGTYQIRVPLGIYRAFVRDDSVLSVGRAPHVRLPGVPSADAAGVPDEQLMPQVMANQDVKGIELGVMHGGTISGKVFDPSGKPLANAVVAALGNVKPALGTDVTETDETGSYKLSVPTGYYKIVATHAKYAGAAAGSDSDANVVEMVAGGSVDENITMAAGCVISGKVVASDGQPANDGAMERQWGTGDTEFGPAGRIDPGGTFRWVTMDEGDVTLRAWPWKSPPSNTMRFACKSGARFANVTLTVQNKGPDISGVLVDHEGQPVPFAFVDLAPLDEGGLGQQERTDATGHWQVFAMPAGRYRFTAQSPEHGVANVEVRSPQSDVRVALAGLGRIEGATPRIANGSFEIAFEACQGGEDTGFSATRLDQRRIVSVVDGRFAIEDVPACAGLAYRAAWHGEPPIQGQVEVPSGAIGHLDLTVGPPKNVHVHGRVVVAGKPLADAIVIALYHSEVTSTKTDASGAYAIDTKQGAHLRVKIPGGSTMADLDEANDTTDVQQDFIVDEEDLPAGKSAPVDQSGDTNGEIDTDDGEGEGDTQTQTVKGELIDI